MDISVRTSDRERDTAVEKVVPVAHTAIYPQYISLQTMLSHTRGRQSMTNLDKSSVSPDAGNLSLYSFLFPSVSISAVPLPDSFLRLRPLIRAKRRRGDRNQNVPDLEMRSVITLVMFFLLETVYFTFYFCLHFTTIKVVKRVIYVVGFSINYHRLIIPAIPNSYNHSTQLLQRN